MNYNADIESIQSVFKYLYINYFFIIFFFIFDSQKPLKKLFMLISASQVGFILYKMTNKAA